MRQATESLNHEMVTTLDAVPLQHAAVAWSPGSPTSATVVQVYLGTARLPMIAFGLTWPATSAPPRLSTLTPPRPRAQPSGVDPRGAGVICSKDAFALSPLREDSFVSSPLLCIPPGHRGLVVATARQLTTLPSTGVLGDEAQRLMDTIMASPDTLKSITSFSSWRSTVDLGSPEAVNPSVASAVASHGNLMVSGATTFVMCV